MSRIVEEHDDENQMDHQGYHRGSSAPLVNEADSSAGIGVASGRFEDDDDDLEVEAEDASVTESELSEELDFLQRSFEGLPVEVNEDRSHQEAEQQESSAVALEWSIEDEENMTGTKIGLPDSHSEVQSKIEGHDQDLLLEDVEEEVIDDDQHVISDPSSIRGLKRLLSSLQVYRQVTFDR